MNEAKPKKKSYTISGCWKLKLKLGYGDQRSHDLKTMVKILFSVENWRGRVYFIAENRMEFGTIVNAKAVKNSEWHTFSVGFSGDGAKIIV